MIVYNNDKTASLKDTKWALQNKILKVTDDNTQESTVIQKTVTVLTEYQH